MNKPKPKYELYTKIVLNELWITIESQDMALRVEEEAGAFGEILSKQGEENTRFDLQIMQLKTETHDHYKIQIRPTFDILEVALWLGRDGIVKYGGAPPGVKREYFPKRDIS